MPEKRGKILVIRGGAIGDFILTLPALAALRATFPNTHLELLGYPALGELALATGSIDAFRSIEARPLARFFARGAELDPDWSAWLESFHLVISYLYDPDEIFKSNAGRASKAQFIQGAHRPNENEPVHAASVFLKPLEQLAIFGADPVPAIPAPKTEPLPPGRWLAVHPGSGSEKKNWPVEKWIELLEGLVRSSSINVLLAGGEAEGDKLDRIMRVLPPQRAQLARNLPLARLAGLLSQCEAFAGHDSGITHLAAAAGIPVLALWGSSNLAIWRPLHPKTRILEAGSSLASLPVPRVAAELARMLG